MPNSDRGCGAGCLRRRHKKFLKNRLEAKRHKNEPATDPTATVADAPLVGEISVADEIKIGSEIAGNLLGAAPLIKDIALQNYVNRVGRWVATQSERPDLPWTFAVIESGDINAFAAPGGFVFVTRGLYKLLGDESELAGVLAHEISHVVKKHHLKIFQKSTLIDKGSKLLSKEIDHGKKSQALLGSGAEITSRGLDKDVEFEADRLGIVLAARAGYEPWGLANVLQAISNVGSDNSVALLFKTHPHPDERLSALDVATENSLGELQGGKVLTARFYRLKN